MELIANDLRMLVQDITEYNQYYNALNADQLNLLIHMNELQDMWEGDGHEQFVDAFNKDYRQMVNIVNFLREVLEDITMADKEYSSCEASIANIIGNMDA